MYHDLEFAIRTAEASVSFSFPYIGKKGFENKE